MEQENTRGPKASKSIYLLILFLSEIIKKSGKLQGLSKKLKEEDNLGKIIPARKFQDLVRETETHNKSAFRWSKDALKLLQVGSEQMLVEYFENGNFMAQHRGRVTFAEKDARALKALNKVYK